MGEGDLLMIADGELGSSCLLVGVVLGWRVRGTGCGLLGAGEVGSEK